MVISRFCFAEDGTELFLSACRTCSTYFCSHSINQICVCVCVCVRCCQCRCRCHHANELRSYFFSGSHVFWWTQSYRRNHFSETVPRYHIKEYSGCLPFAWENCCVLRKFWLEILDYLWRRFENFGNFPVGKSKVAFRLHSNRNFGNFLVNGSKQPVTKRPKGNSLNISKSFDV